MATTANFNLWSPDDGDDWDLTIDLAAMQNSVDLALVGLRSSIGKTAATIAALGSGAFAGQIGWVTSAGAYVVWSGSAWVAPGVQRVADAAARNVLYPTPAQGDRVVMTNVPYRYFGVYNAATNPSGKATAGWYIEPGTLLASASATNTGTGPGATVSVPNLSAGQDIVVNSSPVGVASASASIGTVSLTYTTNGSAPTVGSTVLSNSRITTPAGGNVVSAPGTTRVFTMPSAGTFRATQWATSPLILFAADGQYLTVTAA